MPSSVSAGFTALPLIFFLSFYRPVDNGSVRKRCGLCSGSGKISCTACQGVGLLPHGGFQRKNPPLPPSRLVGSKWTAQEPTLGWRHFQVTKVEVQKAGKKNLSFAELESTCDPDVRMWVTAAKLRDRSIWVAGWKTLDEMRSVAPLGEQERQACPKCSTTGITPCPRCSGLGLL
uniref:Uncharacterized protein n=1 Tax=Cyanoptyche gloeocystis TaxID=77922 RepID=A0A6T9Z5G4_9EUKA|mmetsp:Transcript_2340/g.4304  ORF Transcript_2340/g.4304 Transcript_2340/m.4304 type:complete len:175 (+) Transcript_2340:88-612(+)